MSDKPGNKILINNMTKNRETIRVLTARELRAVRGGTPPETAIETMLRLRGTGAAR